ncbi:Nitrate reductase cytochrome c-type subunit (NapB) [Gimesia aquarii]|uniref:Nitrate reductase cytochrome c-type subunit (NapB) n=2 Tax=Gimesia aquarii TaxID=2527964 RepID=A0A517W182_9PLAN|nr:Nitrate reductase cytochrome c-type subunit (NapB) [Gimesia aquarii]
MIEPMNEQERSTPDWINRRFPLLAGVFLTGCAFVGFLLGISEEQVPMRASWKERPAQNQRSNNQETVPLVVSYSDIATADFKMNPKLAMHFSQLKQQKPGIFDPVIKKPEMKNMAILDRVKTRAFEGAPPTIPHLVDDVRAEKCLVCHGEGVRIGKRTASKMSHPRFNNCVQCHVEMRSDGPFEAAPLNTPNQFVGVARPGPGLRAHPTAPPSVPHATFMREDCMSCHGLLTRPGLRTTHPWFTNCLQCHAPSAVLDQHSFVKLHRRTGKSHEMNQQSSITKQ